MSQAKELALIEAAKQGDLATLKRLVEEGVDVNAERYYRGTTALMFAAMEGRLDCLEYLIAKGAKLDATNNGGMTALMLAAQGGKLDCLELLIAKGAKLDATGGISNQTALHKAAFWGHAPCVEALLKAGADARLKDEDGATALDLAKAEGYAHVIALLKNPAAIAAQVSRRPPPALPGGYKLGDTVVYTAKNYTFANGDKLVHGQQGEVVGPATRKDGKERVAVLFPGNNGSVECRLTRVSRTAPPALPEAAEDKATRGMADLAVASTKDFDLFISHCTKDDSHTVFGHVSAFMSAYDKVIFNPTTHLSHAEQINKEAKQVDRWVETYKAHPNFKYIFRENGRDVVNKQNPGSVTATLKYLATLC